MIVLYHRLDPIAATMAFSTHTAWLAGPVRYPLILAPPKSADVSDSVVM
jgi:hypothetical protein